MASMSMVCRLAVALLLGAACLMPARTFGQSPEQIRTLCKDSALREALLARVQNKDQRAKVELELEARCAQIDLPATPVHDAADPSPAGSHADWVFDARFSADGRTIVSASRDGTVRVWDAATGKPIRRIVVAEDDPTGDPRKKGIVRSVRLVGDGTRAAAASDRNPVRLIELASGKILANVPVTSGGSFGGTIAATAGGLLFIGGYTDIVEAIDANTQAVRYRLPGHQMEASAIAVSDKAGLVATAASSTYSKPEANQIPRILLWKLGTGEKVGEITPQVDTNPQALAFSRDGAQLAIVSGGFMHIYSVADKRMARSIDIRPMNDPFGVAFTADGKGLITCTTHPILWDLATGKRVRHFGPFHDLCHSVDVSPDGRFAVTTSMGSDVRIWEIATGTFHRRLGINVKTAR